MEQPGIKLLQQKLLSKFIKKPVEQLQIRTITSLIREEHTPIEKIFYARYDRLFLQNISNKKGSFSFIYLLGYFGYRVDNPKGLGITGKGPAGVILM